MKLSEFIAHLQHIQQRHPDEDPVVGVAIQNPQIPGTAISSVSTGFDWNKGKLFLGTELMLKVTHKIYQKDIEVMAGESLKNYTTVTELPKARKHCYIDGFIAGIKRGMYLEEEK